MESEIIQILDSSDYYEILGLNSTEKNTVEDVKSAFKKQALKFHPDKNKEEKSSEAFNKINRVYKILNNEEMKSFYDEVKDDEEFKEKFNEQKVKNPDVNEFDLFEAVFKMNKKGGGKKNQNQSPSYIGLIINVITTAIIFYYMNGKKEEEGVDATIKNNSYDIESIVYSGRGNYRKLNFGFEKKPEYPLESITEINDIVFYHNEVFMKRFDLDGSGSNESSEKTDEEKEVEVEQIKAKKEEVSDLLLNSHF